MRQPDLVQMFAFGQHHWLWLWQQQAEYMFAVMRYAGGVAMPPARKNFKLVPHPPVDC